MTVVSRPPTVIVYGLLGTINHLGFKPQSVYDECACDAQDSREHKEQSFIDFSTESRIKMK